MPPSIPFGLAAGLATALLFASAGAGGMTGRVILFFLAPLPSYLAGLGWGWVSAAIAAATSAVVTSMILGARTGFVFMLSQGLPLVTLCYLVMLSRPAALTAPLPPGSPPPLQWYPIGRIVAVATVIAGALSLVSILLLGADLEALRTMMRELVDRMLEKQLPGLGGDGLGDAERTALAGMLLHALPAGTATLWLGGFLLNLWLGGKIMRISGHLTRPWPDVRLMRFPRGFGLGLALAIAAASLLPDVPSLLATGFVGAFLLAYLLMGLAIIHYATQGMAARAFVLWGVYLGLILFNSWAALVIALLAILEPLMWYRRPDLPEDGGPAPPVPPTPPAT
ncbi:MAG: DUF2232 domain-containing protein [Hyphomicrobiaceae bacterium]